MRNSPFRLLISALLAVPVALGLFMVMNALIDSDFEQDELKSRKIADIVTPEETIETNVKEQKPEKVEDPEQPPPEMQPLDFDMDMDTNVANIAPTTGVDISISSSGMSSGDGEYLPIVKVAPIALDVQNLRQQLKPPQPPLL